MKVKVNKSRGRGGVYASVVLIYLCTFPMCSFGSKGEKGQTPISSSCLLLTNPSENHFTSKSSSISPLRKFPCRKSETSIGFPPEAGGFLHQKQEKIGHEQLRQQCDNVLSWRATDSGHRVGCRLWVWEEHLHEEADQCVWRSCGAPRGGNPDSNTLISDTTTVICLDDYHSLDRTGRKEKGVTALDPRANDFDLMYEQVKAIKDGIAVEKPIYNHVTGLLDPPETIKPPKILVIEGLHPMYDARVRDLLDFSIYLDISNEVKFAWKIQRDMAERGHSLESIKASIEARKPDFDAYIDPQKQYADAVIEVLPTQLIPDDNEGKVLRVRLIMKEGVTYFSPVYLFDEGSTISWIPCGRKLTCSYPGINFSYGPDTYYGHEVSVLEMDGQFDRLDELIYVESHLSNISTKFYGEITQQLLKHSDFPGSNNGTGLFQTIVGLKIRDLFEQIVASRAATPLEATKA
ncbi:Phosphoribulokinase, chloroplastic [Vitis vinifera]|uniref:Phosphoribulokinase n=1 Tax=Vitis vinifera TaxID=29760 RepID=A0A438G9L8_VITVI|nr:Phosphoribulokinase, chloroplastic [Vitis vinifera]